MQEILEQLVTRCRAGETVALCTIVGSQGSTPQEKGAKMLVLAGGQCIGTLGGGCVEAEVRKRTLELILAGKSDLCHFKLDHDYGWDDGLICGGSLDIYIDVISELRVGPFDRLLSAVKSQRSDIFQIEYHLKGQCRHYVEEIGQPPNLVLAGAGHVAQALAKLAVPLDFRVTVIDDRADFASADRFADPITRVVGDIEHELKRFEIDPGTFVVIVTRGHQRDGQALRAVIEGNARYIGMIGSKRKVKTIFDDLIEQGVDREKLSRVHAPIGYEIGAVTVPEIALSIAAELVAVRRGREGREAVPMKFTSATKSRSQRSATCPEKPSFTNG